MSVLDREWRGLYDDLENARDKDKFACDQSLLLQVYRTHGIQSKFFFSPVCCNGRCASMSFAVGQVLTEAVLRDSESLFEEPVEVDKLPKVRITSFHHGHPKNCFRSPFGV